MSAPFGNTNATKAWDDERDDALKACLADRMTFSETASVLNKHFGTACTRSAVAGRAMRLKLKSKNPAARRPKVPPTQTERRAKKAAAMRAWRGQQEKVIAMPPATPRFHRDALPPLRCAEVESLNVPLLELEPHQCRWPVSGEREHTLFCASPKVEGSSYCGPHRSLALGDPRGRSPSSPAQLAHLRSLMPQAHVLNSIFPGEEA